MSRLTTDRILVVGGGGYIGSHCCKALKSYGFVPVVYDNFSTGHRDFVKWGPLIEGDVRDRDRLSKVMREYEIVAVMHFAAMALVNESITEPARYWDVNVRGTLALLEAMHEVKIDRLVFSSTCAVYGETTTVPIHEDVLKNPVNPYGSSKLAAEQMMDDFGVAYGLRSVRLRYFNACGADPDLEIGEHHEFETHLIPLVLNAAHKPSSSISIFGTDFPTPDGTAIRDYVHVIDIAYAHIEALKYLLDNAPTTVLNIGTGAGNSVAAVISTAERIVGTAIRQLKVDRRPGDPAILIADPRKAFQVLKWQAKHSDLETIIRDAWAWHQRRFGFKTD